MEGGSKRGKKNLGSVYDPQKAIVFITVTSHSLYKTVPSTFIADRVTKWLAKIESTWSLN